MSTYEELEGAGTDEDSGEITLSFGDVQDPGVPEGIYLVIITKAERTISSKKKTPGIRFHAEVAETISNSDKEERDHFGKKLSGTEWITPNSMFRVKKALECITGEEFAEDDMNVNLKDLEGMTARVQVTKSEPDDKGRVWSNITDWFPKEKTDKGSMFDN